MGDGGNIRHYDGVVWRRLVSGTTIDIVDIWGGTNAQTEEQTVLALASRRAQVPQAKKLLQIQGTTVTAISDSGLRTGLDGIWFVPGKKYYVSGDGLFFVNQVGAPWQTDTTQPLIYKYAVRGNDVNDVFVVGAFGLVSHYNGSTWKQYMGGELPSFSGSYYKVAVRKDFVIAVGYIGEKAIVLRGRR